MVVRMRATHAHTRNRRSHHALSGKRLSVDTKTGAVHPRHRAMLDGTPYRGRSVMDKTKKAVKSTPVKSDKTNEKKGEKKVKKEKKSK